MLHFRYVFFIAAMLFGLPNMTQAQDQQKAIEEVQDAILNQRNVNPLTMSALQYNPMEVIVELDKSATFQVREELEAYLRVLRFFLDTYGEYDPIKERVIESMAKQYSNNIKGAEFLIFRYALNGTPLTPKSVTELSKVICQTPLALNYYGMLAKYIPPDTLLELARRHYPRLDKCYPAAACLSSIYKSSASDGQIATRLIDEYILIFDSLSCKDKVSVGFFFRNFKKTEFSQEQRTHIANLVRKHKFVSLVQLAGYLDIVELRPDLEAIASQHEDSNANWYAHLALARMGDKVQLDYCMAQIAQLPPAELIKTYTDDLAYLRTTESFELLLNLLFMDIKEDSEDDKFVAELVALSLEGKIIDFPKIGNNMSAQEFLPIARAWIKSRKGNFELKKDCF